MTRPPEKFLLGRHAAYLWCPNGILESRAAEALLGRAGRAATSRNWSTVGKIAALLERQVTGSILILGRRVSLVQLRAPEHPFRFADGGRAPRRAPLTASLQTEDWTNVNLSKPIGHLPQPDLR